MSFQQWLGRRENGMRQNFGDVNQIMKRVYASMELFNSWNELDINNFGYNDYGALFNLEFSPNGNILAGACEKKAVTLFDTISQCQTVKIMDAHTDNVNCIKFLDNQTFATCSDDTTVAIWDVRFLKKRLRTLKGHSNWVKNIEYSVKDKLLVTSGFDGSIFTWDINSHTEEGLVYQKVFNTSGLMRCRISPDCNKLVLCTTGGYLMIIHNLDLKTLQNDLCGFRPCIYRLMQMGNQYIPQAAKFDYVFSKKMKRNRVELVTDFPNQAEIIIALQIHPHGLSFISRNISYDECSEWSCVHDLNEASYDITVRKPEKRKRTLSDDEENNLPTTSRGKPGGCKTTRRIRKSVDLSDLPSTSAASRAANAGRGANSAAGTSARTASTATGVRQGPVTRNASRLAARNSAQNETPTASTSNRSDFVPDIWAAEITVQQRANRQARGRQTNSVTGYDFVYAINSGILPNSSPTPSPEEPDPNDFIPRRGQDELIIQNANKLMYYIKELNIEKGYIKEPSFSADGRIICSPYSTGFRLLAYSEDCSDHSSISMNEKAKQNPRPLVEIKTVDTHEDIVLSSSFSPTQPLLVTGCKLGKLVWYLPNL